MIRVRQCFRAVLMFVFAVLAADGAFTQDTINVSNTEEILITSVRRSEAFRESQKGDEALLIRDKSEIAKLVALFDKNVQHKVHACGYHWRLTFYKSSGNPTEIYFNEKCEEFDRNTEAICEIVQAKFRQTVEQPNAYISNVDIDVRVAPERAEAELNSKGRLRVLVLQPVRRLPYVEIRATSTSSIPADRSLWNAEKTKVVQHADRILLTDIGRIRQKYNVVETGELMHGMSMFGGGKILEERRVKLYFDVGINIGNVGEILKESKVAETVSPTAYRLQILTGARLTEPEILKLKRDFPFVRAVENY
jgi:hypothetical protein